MEHRRTPVPYLKLNPLRCELDATCFTAGPACLYLHLELCQMIVLLCQTRHKLGFVM